jgi:predicted protein tyrosine phosphatase
MSVHPDLSKISKITDNIFLSGIFPLDKNYQIIKKLNIKYILSCVDREYVSDIHNKIMTDNPDLTILYIPYNDDNEQNLWKKNKNQIIIHKFTGSLHEHDKLKNQLEIYNNKPMIEIGYHFIDDALLFQKNVLIHCMAGVSRSVSMIAYYLMKKYHIDYNDVINYIRNKRSIVNPNDSFKSQLKIYQNKRECFTENDADNIIHAIRYTNRIQ